MTKYLVTYTVEGAFSVEADDPVKAKEKVAALTREIPGNMRTELAVHYLEELT
jgi:hypothetical protein